MIWQTVGIVVFIMTFVVGMIPIMSLLEVDDFIGGVMTGLVTGLIPTLILWVIDRIDRDEPLNEKSFAMPKQRQASLLFVALVIVNITYWTFTLVWFSGFQETLKRLIDAGELEGITPYADHALQKVIAGGLFMSSWLPLTLLTCVILGVFLDRLKFPLIVLANGLALGAFVVVKQTFDWVRSDLSIELIVETISGVTIDNAPFVTWDRAAFFLMALGTLLLVLLALSLMMSVSLSIGAWLRRGVSPS